MAVKIKRKTITKKRRFKLSPKQLLHRKYLRSAKWTKKKDEFRRSSFFRGCCFICKKTQRLHIHHLTYVNWMNEKPEDLIELCPLCHKNIHAAERKGIPFSKIVSQLRDLGLVSFTL